MRASWLDVPRGRWVRVPVLVALQLVFVTHVAAGPGALATLRSPGGAKKSKAGKRAAQAAATREARAFHEAGVAKRAAGDFPGALVEFQRAEKEAEKIPDRRMRGRVLPEVLFDLASTHVDAYHATHDAQHLHTGKQVLERYFAVDTPSKPHEADAQLLQTAIDDALAKRETDAAKKKANGLVIGGAVIAGLSSAGFALMGVGLARGKDAVNDYEEGPTRADRDAADSRGRSANIMAISGGVVAGLLLAAGITVVILGKKRRDRALAVAPVVSPWGAELTLNWSF